MFKSKTKTKPDLSRPNVAPTSASSWSDSDAVSQAISSSSDPAEYIRITVVDPSKIVANLSLDLDPEPGLKDARIELCQSSQSGDVCRYFIGFDKLNETVAEHPILKSVDDTIDVKVYFPQENKTVCNVPKNLVLNTSIYPAIC